MVTWTDAGFEGLRTPALHNVPIYTSIIAAHSLKLKCTLSHSEEACAGVGADAGAGRVLEAHACPAQHAHLHSQRHYSALDTDLRNPR